MDVVDKMEMEGPNKGDGEENVRKVFAGIRTRLWRKFEPLNESCLFASIQLKEIHVILLYFFDILKVCRNLFTRVLYSDKNTT